MKLSVGHFQIFVCLGALFYQIFSLLALYLLGVLDAFMYSTVCQLFTILNDRVPSCMYISAYPYAVFDSHKVGRVHGGFPIHRTMSLCTFFWTSRFCRIGNGKCLESGCDIFHIATRAVPCLHPVVNLSLLIPTHETLLNVQGTV